MSILDVTRNALNCTSCERQPRNPQNISCGAGRLVALKQVKDSPHCPTASGLTRPLLHLERTRANLTICAGLEFVWDGSFNSSHSHPGPGLVSNALISDQVSLAEGISIQIHIARNAANQARGADLPIGPVALAAAGHPGIAAVAAAPRVAGVQVLAVIIGDPGREVDTARLIGTRSGRKHRCRRCNR